MIRKGEKYGSIELRHLRHFIAATECGSFRKAANIFGISPLAISRSISNLEDQLGASLFHRHTSGVSTTHTGQRFLTRAYKVIATIDAGINDTEAAGRWELGHVRIGIYSSIASGFLARLLRSYSRCYDNIKMDIINGSSVEHISAIRRISLDVAFIAEAINWTECEQEYLWSERLFVALPDFHDLSSNLELCWHDIAHETFIVSDAPPGPEIQDHLIRCLSEIGQYPKIQAQRVSRDNLVSMVALGQGLTLVSEAMTMAKFPGVTYRPVHDEFLAFSAIWSPRNDNPAFRRFLSLAKKLASREHSARPAPTAVLSRSPDRWR